MDRVRGFVSSSPERRYHPPSRLASLFAVKMGLMSIETAEQLKRDLTDRWVVVDQNVPELRRFQGLTGRVKTVNMNCRALVEFDGPADIGWYDIDPGYLKVVDGPVKKVKPAEHEKPAAKPVAAPAGGGKSPLDMIRAQGAPKAAAPAAGGAKPSPLDLIRQQGAAKAGGDAAPAAGGAKPSPLDLIRQQGAAKSGSAAEPAPAADAPAQPAAEAPKPAPAAGGEKLSPLDLIRKQGAAKR